MMDSDFNAQLSSAILLPNNNWDIDTQKRLSALKNPDFLIGPRVDLLQGDISREWYKWIVDQFVDKSFFNGDINYFEIHESIDASIEFLVGNQKDHDDKRKLVTLLSDMVEQRINFLTEENRKRSRISIEIKEDLLKVYGPEPRCWLTGMKFSKEALYNFTAKKTDQVKLNLPAYVDRYRPIGTNERDLQIEVDHLHPFSLGGRDDLENYRLVCGWANKVKSNHITGYSPGTRVSGPSHIFPRSFYYWVIRTIGLKRKCEIPGCRNKVENSELTVCSGLGETKAITPVSMKVVCKEHDIRSSRYIRRESIKDPFYI